MTNKWESSPPEKGGTYLVILSDDRFSDDRLEVLSYTKSRTLLNKLKITDKNGVWYKKRGCGYFFYYDIVYWTKIPKIPKGE